ncbi:polyamine aminopropyltransferase [Candidatus Micrarchaeota archaeon]|nr:polyamine aminopropyltransferase [Candidatus Micrarchaeota archaeon]
MGKDENLEKERAWGLLTSLDLHECDPEIVENEEKLKEYVITLCKMIDMKRYGEVHAHYFGEDPIVKGYTVYQLIETSMISGHFGLNPGGETGYGYIDIFSCKSYDTEEATKFTKEFFKAKTFNKNVLYRRYWFEEKFEAQKGRAMRIEINEKLEDVYSKYQHIKIFDTKAFGKMLVLDETVMLTEYDEFAYHEMLTHVALNTHPNPKRVLVIGGGDGGIIREIARHPGVEEIHLCELDEKVIEVSKKHLPSVAAGFDDPRAKVFIEDGAKFVRENKGYDIVIVDSPDPVGPAEALFTKEFYQNIYDGLNEDGILVTQSESMYYHQQLISRLSTFIPEIFEKYWYYYSLVPTYPSGVIGFSFCSKKYDPIKDFNKERAEKLEGVRYYNAGMHTAAFSLPTFIKKKI